MHHRHHRKLTWRMMNHQQRVLWLTAQVIKWGLGYAIFVALRSAVCG